MLAHFLNSKATRKILIISLIFLLLDPGAYLLANSLHPTSEDKDYWKMTDVEILREVDKLDEAISKIDIEKVESASQVFGKRNNEYTTATLDLTSKIWDKEALAEAKQLTINKYEADVEVLRTEPTEAEMARIQQLTREILQLKTEIGKRRYPRLKPWHLILKYKLRLT